MRCHIDSVITRASCMNIRFFLVVIISCPFLAACGKQWTKPGATSEQVSADIEACEKWAAEEFPVAMSSPAAGNQQTFEVRYTNEGNEYKCPTRTGGGGSFQFDQNKEAREQAIRQCLELRGYSR